MPVAAAFLTLPFLGILVLSLHFNSIQQLPNFLLLGGFLFGIYFCAVYWAWTNRTKWSVSRRALFWIGGTAILFRLLIFLEGNIFLSDDIFRYIWDGRVQEAHINPYLFAPINDALYYLRDDLFPRINHAHLKTIYPPFAQVLFFVTSKFGSTVLAFRGMSMVFDLGIVALLLWRLKDKGKPWTHALIYAWNPLVLYEFSGQGHIDSAMLFFLMAGILLIEKKKKWSGGAALAAGFLIKGAAGVSFFWFALRRQFRPLISAGCFILLAFWLYKFHVAFSGDINSGAKAYATTWEFNGSLFPLIRMGIDSNMLVRGILFVVGVILMGYLALRIKEIVEFHFWAILLLLFLSPTVHPWYVVWIVPFLVFQPWVGGLVWTLMAGATYHVLIQYSSNGIWELSPLIWVGEYILVFGAFGAQYFYIKKKNPASV